MSVIENNASLATTALRTDALALVEAGLTAINTEYRIQETIKLSDGVLTVGDRHYTVSDYDSIHVIGFGKASSKAAQAIETILGDALTGGIVLDKTPLVCKRVVVYQGAHPQPTQHNVEVSEKIAALARGLTERDLAIVIVSGGGSSLLCWPLSECDQGARLYGAFLHAGGTINELNVLRKHLSGIKGGGLAQLLYPATVVGLVFCDVPGEHYDVVASGPTYYDETTVDDAKALLKKYNIQESFDFVETPKDKKYFERVVNVPIVSNVHALDAMRKKAEALGYTVHSIGAEWYEAPSVLIDTMLATVTPHSVVIGAGEPKMTVEGAGGLGGRNEYTSALMIEHIPEQAVFVSYASDGIDNCSIAAGGLIDSAIQEKAKTLPKPLATYIETYQHDDLLEQLDARIITGPTESNVSDVFLLIKE